MSTIALGGNINLVGFKDLHHTELIVVKKLVGNYMRKLSTTTPVNELTLTVKPIHHTDEDSSKYELKANLNVNGKHYFSDLTDFNLYVGIDSIMKKLESQLVHAH